ncbi:MAG: hypothetical protein LAT63_07470 [Marinobacter sp.]|nr:hypothetical protein [Marinobacter sp.]
MDLLIPIVFPDYRITVATPSVDVDVFPWTDRFGRVSVPSRNTQVSNLGHAGVLFVKGTTGLTRYYEYGRYDPPENLGIVRRIRIPDANVVDGAVDLKSLRAPLRRISALAGQMSRIQGVLIGVGDTFEAMESYAQQRKMLNNTPSRTPYHLTRNSCIHFVKGVARAGGVSTPWMIDPRPNGYIGRFRREFRDIDYDYSADRLVLQQLEAA